MRFLLLHASLFLLMQPIEGNTSNEPQEKPNFATYEYKNLPLKDLETRLSLAESTANGAKKKLDNANTTLDNDSKEATRLNQEYEEKKMIFGNLSAATKELNSAKRKLKEIREELNEARANVTSINGRPRERSEAEGLLRSLEQSKPTKTLKQLKSERDAAKEIYELWQDDEMDALSTSIKNDKCNDPNAAKPKCDDQLKLLSQYTADRKSFETAQAELEKLENYPAKFKALNDKINELKDLIQQDNLQSAQDKVDQLVTVEKDLDQHVNETKEAIKREPKKLQIVNLEMIKAKEAKEKAENEVVAQEKVMNELKKEWEDQNGKVNALKELITEKQKGTKDEADNAGFESWKMAVIIIAVVVIVVVAVATFVCCKRRQKKRNEDEGKALNPKDSKSADKISGTMHPKDKTGTKSSENEYDPSHPPPGTPEIVTEQVTKNIKPGTMVRRVMAHDGEIETHFERKDGLTGKIDGHGHMRADFEGTGPNAVKLSGVVVMKHDYPPNHANIYENALDLPNLHKVDIDRSLITARIYGKDVEIFEDREKVVNNGPSNVIAESKMKADKPKNEVKRSRAGKSEKSEKSNRTETRVTGGGTTGNGGGTTAGGTTGGENTTDIGRTTGLLEVAHFDREIDNTLTKLTRSEYVKGLRFSFTIPFLREMIKKAMAILIKEPHLVMISHPVAVCGDLHAQYDMLHRIFSTFANENGPGWTQIKWVFMGDYVDRGTQGLEVISMLVLLKIKNKSSFVLLRGNHETRAVNYNYGFRQEILDRFPDQPDEAELLYDEFNQLFNVMSPTCLISGTILVMHGGITPQLVEDVKSINQFQKPVDPSKDGNKWMSDLLWSDPEEGVEGFHNNDRRSGGLTFGEDSVKALEKQGITKVFRAHQPMANGLKFIFGIGLCTIFSCDRNVGNVSQEEPNMSAVALINKEGHMGWNLLMQGTDKGIAVTQTTMENGDEVNFGKTIDQNNKAHRCYYTTVDMLRGVKQDDLTQMGQVEKKEEVKKAV